MIHARLRAAAGRDRIPTDGLVAWYTMDNISGSTLVDETGNYDGTITGATQVSGIIGQALDFDGVNDSVKISGIPSGRKYSFSFWLNTTYNDTGFQPVIEQSPNYNNNSGAFLVGMEFLEGSKKFYFGVKKPADYHIRYIPLSDINDGVWHHVQIVYDGDVAASGQIKIWLDNVESSLGIGPAKFNNFSAVDLSLSDVNIGARDGSSFFTAFQMDAARIYNRVLVQSDADALYSEGA